MREWREGEEGARGVEEGGRIIKVVYTLVWRRVYRFYITMHLYRKMEVLSLSKVPCILEGEPKTCSPVSGPRITSASCPLIGLGGALSKQGLPDHVNGLLSRIARLKSSISIVLFLYNMKLCHY